MKGRVAKPEDGVPEFKRFFRGFIVKRALAVGMEITKYTFTCRTCGRKYHERCSITDLPSFNYQCKHIEKIDRHKGVVSDLCEGWLQVAKREHNTLVAAYYKDANKDLRMFSFNKFTVALLDLAKVRNVTRLDPETIAISQPTHGLVIGNVVFLQDERGVWPKITEISKYLRTQLLEAINDREKENRGD